MLLTEFLRDYRLRKDHTISMRLTEKEKFIADKLKGSFSYSDHYIYLIKYLAGEEIPDKLKFNNAFPKKNFDSQYNKMKNQIKL